MADILFVTWDGGGNVPPATALAGELLRRGHAARFLGHASLEEPLTDQGFAFVRPRHARPFDSRHDYSPLRMLGVFADTGLARDLDEALAVRPADLLVIDALMFGALDAARRGTTPYVTLEHMYDAAYRGGILGGPMGLNLRLRGLAPRRALDAARLRLLMTLPELDPAAAPNLRQVGPLASWSTGTTERGPRVVVSLSTFGYPGMATVLQRIIDATQGLGARVLVSTGPVLDPGEVRARPDVDVHRWLPHAAALPGAAVLVTHGGHGSAMAALAHDVPLLVVPLDPLADHRVVGRSIEGAGAGSGRMVSRRAGVPTLRGALTDLITDPSYRAAAARLGGAIRAADAVGASADAVEEVLRGGAPARGRPAARP